MLSFFLCLYWEKHLATFLLCSQYLTVLYEKEKPRQTGPASGSVTTLISYLVYALQAEARARTSLVKKRT